MKPTDEQVFMLANLEQKHGSLVRMPDGTPLAEEILSNCVSDTRLYACRNCGCLFAVEPDGETDVYALVD